MTDEVVEPAVTAPAKKAKRARQPKASAPNAAAASTAAPPAGQRDLLIGMAAKTTLAVNRAASILEEELATGIGATQNIEQKLVDVETLRSADSREVVQRLRKDAHDVVDILVDLVKIATKALDGLSERALSIGWGSARPTGEKPAARAIPSLAVPTAVKPGERVEIPMTLENESNKPTEAFNFHSSDLVNPAGERISSQQISFSPEQLVIEPQQASVVTVIIRVPENATPGIYSGLLQASRLDQLRAVLSIQIV